MKFKNKKTGAILEPNSKLTEEQISKCKEGNVRGVFGYPTLLEELAGKTGRTEQEIDYIISNYGTMEHFIQSYKSKKQDDLPSIEIRNLASSMLRNAIDIDLNPNSKGYDALYSNIMHSDIMHIEQTDNTLELYSSERLKEQLETLPQTEKNVIERRYGLLLDDLPRDLESVALEIGVSRERVRQIEVKALRRLRDPRRVKQFHYTFDKSDMLTEDECKIIDELENNLYASDLIFRNNPHISPDDARSEDIIKAFELIKNMREITEERKEQQRQEPKKALKQTIDELDFSIRTYNVLKRAGIKTLEDISQLTEDEFSKIRYANKIMSDEVAKKLGEYGLTFREDTKKEEASENESQATHEAENEDAFIDNVVKYANSRVKAREQNEQAGELAQKCEEVFGKRVSNDGQPFNSDGNR